MDKEEILHYLFAGMALQGTLANSVLFDLIKKQAESVHLDFKEAVADFAVEFADELVRQLQRERR